MRLDLLLVKNGLAASRSKAQELIGGGYVTVNGKPAAKSSLAVDEDCAVAVTKNDEYVSRGGKKLEKALKEFIIDVRGSVCIDIGASTGGFCDCLLRNGAEKIYAVDSGHGQLDAAIAANPAVISMEGTNARELTPQKLGERADLLTCDVSFISVTLLFGVFYELLKEGGSAVVLIKPQFEAGRGNVGKSGVVKDPKLHAAILASVLENAVAAGFFVSKLTFSPITGGDGNIEFLTLLEKRAAGTPAILPDIDAAVRAAHKELYGKD